jgi:multidrug efflux system membrane fusion protein
VQAYDQGNDKQLAEGDLSTFDNTVDTTTGTVKLRATFPNADLGLFPNEFVNARMVLQTLNNVVEVPVRAVQYGAPGSFVYLLNPNSTVSVRVIKTGVTEGDEMQVLSGLKAGDKVVTDGVSLLRQGAKVRVTPEAGAPQTTVNAGPGAPPGAQRQNAAPTPKGRPSRSAPG